MSRTLYDREHHGTRISLEAERDEAGQFVMAGQDIGEAPMRILGDSDYEYWYIFDADQERLLESRLREQLANIEPIDLSGESGVEDPLGLAFSSGLFETANALRSFLIDHSIGFEFAGYS